MKFWLTLLLTITLLPVARSEEARFFRIAGPVATTITAFSADGYVTWINTLTNATFTVQTALSLVGPSNWVDYVQVPVTNPVTIHRLYDPSPPVGMALIPAGSFTMGNCMGTNEGSIAELPLHTVYVSAFYMDRYEVTKALWDDVYQWATNHGYRYSLGSAVSGKAANYPVHSILWDQAALWCNARSQKEGLSACYYTDASQSEVYMTGGLNLTNACVKWSANGYRLPTEAEWEKAARGGASERRFPWTDTDTITQSRANYNSYWTNGQPHYPYDENATNGYYPTFEVGVQPYTSPVGYFAPNGYGLYDMAGNLWELCWDWYDQNWYSNPFATQSDPGGPSEAMSAHVVRGGGWLTFAFSARCANRNNLPPMGTFNMIGFRCVRRP